MEVYLIRHTKPLVQPHMIYGQTDLELADSFPEEITNIRKKLPERTPDQIYTSPLKRCLELANHLRQHQEPVVVCDKLKEMNFGDLELTEFPSMSPVSFKKWAAKYLYQPTPQGESYDMLSKRFQSFWHDLRNAGPDFAYVVAHAGIFRMALGYLLGMPLHKTFSFCLHYGVVIRVKYIFDDIYDVEFL